MQSLTVSPRALGLLLASLVCGISCSRPAATPRPEQASPSSEDESSQVDPQGAPLTLVSSVWSPFTDVEGKPRIASALVQEALRRIGQPVTFATRPFPEVTASLQGGDFAGSEALWKSPEREEYLLFSTPYLENRLVLLGRKGADVSASTLGALSEKRLGLVEDYAYGSAVEQATMLDKAFFATDEDALRALLRGDVDYILVDDLLVYHLFEHENERAKELLVAGRQPLVLRGLHLALRKDFPGAPKLLTEFDAAIQDMVRAGDYHRILNVHWIEVDADQDGKPEFLATEDQVGTQTPEFSYSLFGARAQGTPRFMIGDEVYEDWSTVPDRYKVPPESVDGFRPGINAVLFEF